MPRKEKEMFQNHVMHTEKREYMELSLCSLEQRLDSLLVRPYEAVYNDFVIFSPL